MVKRRKLEQSVFVTQIGEGLNSDHIVFTLKELVSEFFTVYPFFKETPKKFGKNKKHSHEDLLCFICLCYIKEIRTYRKMSDALKSNDESLFYALGSEKVSKTVISDFVNSNGFLFTEFLYFTVIKAREYGLVKNEVLSLDGTFLKAYANNNNRISRDEIKNLQKVLRKLDFENKKNRLQLNLKKYLDNPIPENKLKQVENVANLLNKNGIKLLKEGLESDTERNRILTYLNSIMSYHSSNSKFDINLTDPESVFVYDKKGVKGYNFNFQVVRDEFKGIIVTTSVVNDNNDKNQLIPMLESSIMVLQEKPKFFLADNGYYTYKALHYCFINNINLIIPDGAEARRQNNNGKNNPYAKHKFQYDRHTDTYTCPEGVKLKLNRIVGESTVKTKVYSTNECLNCEKKQECYKTRVREIRDKTDSLTEHFKDKYFSTLGQKLYKKRANLSEGIYATIKELRNFNGLKRKGREKCLITLNIESISHNIRIINRELNSKNQNSTENHEYQSKLVKKQEK